jgi:hypothetical protein
MRFILLCLLMGRLLSVATCQTNELQAQQSWNQQPISHISREWRAANFRGLMIGQSTREDMLHLLGQPQSSGPPDLQTEDELNPEIWNNYESGGELPGKLTVIVDARSSTILGIDLYPENLTREEAINHFGKDYITTRYDFDSCLSKDDGESAPLYESPTGSVTYIEYRARGIALGMNGMGKVDQISYIAKPIGATSSKCKTTITSKVKKD